MHFQITLKEVKSVSRTNMSYKLESENHALFLRRSITNWTKTNPDVILISSDGQKMHCHRFLKNKLIMF